MEVEEADTEVEEVSTLLLRLSCRDDELLVTAMVAADCVTVRALNISACCGIVSLGPYACNGLL